MNCAEYGPWVSRYVDEDLEGKELDAFLEHLSDCRECQREVRALERLTGWLQAADALQGMPEITADWGLEDLLRQEQSVAEAGRAELFLATVDRSAFDPRKPRRWSLGWIKRYLFPLALPARNAVRFVLALLVVAVTAIWLTTRKTSDWIDVRDLQTVSSTTVALPEEEGHEMDFYVMQHTRHQPWADNGDELPMVELASTSSP
jgi:anti-sigma factor RsiW